MCYKNRSFWQDLICDGAQNEHANWNYEVFLVMAYACNNTDTNISNEKVRGFTKYVGILYFLSAFKNYYIIIFRL